jgi:2-methylcitrate dehydratase PrpD
VARALGPEHQVPHGFHTTATSGIFGATAAAGKLLKLDEGQMTQALGIAGSCVGGTEAYLQEGAWTNSLHCGKPASDGIACAILAQNGFTGPKWVFEGVDGILQTYSPRGTADPSMLTDGLGSKWYFGERFIGYKRYASCGSMHPCLDAFMELTEENSICPDEIVEVTTWSGFNNYKFNCTPPWRKVEPASTVEGIFSMPFCIGILAYRRRLTVAEWVEPNILTDARIRSLAKKVNCLVRYDHEPSTEVRVDIMTKSGKVHSTSGAFRRPLTLHELESKFAMNNSVSGLLNEDQLEEMKNLVYRLDSLPNLDEVTGLLRPTT